MLLDIISMVELQLGIRKYIWRPYIQNSYNDTGTDIEIVSKLPPDINTSGGIKAKHAIFALGRQFALE